MTTAIGEKLSGLCDPHSKVERFRSGRTRQTDQAYLGSCAITTDAERAMALAVRRAVANVGLVDSQYISHDARWPDDLGVLPVWDSMDAMAYIMALEEEIGFEISDEHASKLFDYNNSVSVLDLVRRASEVLGDMITHSQEDEATSGDEVGA